MEEQKDVKIIDLRKVWQAIKLKRKLYYKVLPIVFILSCVWIFPQPRYYATSVSLAPEANNAGAGGGLSSIASMVGVNLGGMENNDAIYPVLYPELFESPAFTVSLLDIQVKTADGELSTDYYTYLKDYQQVNWLTKPFTDAVKWVKKFFKEKKPDVGGGAAGKINPFRMSDEDYALVKNAQDAIKCAVDRKTDVTTISVQDQDPLVCAILADSVKQRLQDFIIQYRTSKARLDMEYYAHLMDSAKVEYEQAMQEYSIFCDTHKDVILQSYVSQRDGLEEAMQQKLSTYKAMNTQYEAMRAKVQEYTPAFTTLKSATVPIKPDGPKRVIFIAAMLILAAFAITVYAVKDELAPKNVG